MVTSDEERQGVTEQGESRAAELVAEPVPAIETDPVMDSPEPLKGEVEPGADETEGPSDEAAAPSTEAADERADGVESNDAAPPPASNDAELATSPPPPTMDVEEIDAPPADDGAVAPTMLETAAPHLPADDPAAHPGLSEDEATGRRVESLLAEAPDADPQGVQPARGDVIAPMTFDAAPMPFGSVATVDDPVDDELSLAAAATFRAGLRRNGMDRVGPIVAFDFDGTLTVRDSFTAFLRWREGSARYHAEMAALAPAALKYLFDRDPGKLKAAAVRRFLQGLPREVLNAEAMEFATISAPILFRPDALRAWRRFRQDGARLMIVTASPENIVAPFARGLGCDLLIGTQLLFDPEDRVQGGLLGDNCRGPEKVRRIRQALGEDVVLAAAYGDTDGDWDMLEMAEQQFMRLFVGTPGKPGGPT